MATKTTDLSGALLRALTPKMMREENTTELLEIILWGRGCVKAEILSMLLNLSWKSVVKNSSVNMMVQEAIEWDHRRTCFYCWKLNLCVINM